MKGTESPDSSLRIRLKKSAKWTRRERTRCVDAKGLRGKVLRNHLGAGTLLQELKGFELLIAMVCNLVAMASNL